MLVRDTDGAEEAGKGSRSPQTRATRPPHGLTWAACGWWAPRPPANAACPAGPRGGSARGRVAVLLRVSSPLWLLRCSSGLRSRPGHT